MRKTRGSILHDGRTCASTHYDEIFATFMDHSDESVGSEKSKRVRSVLFSVSPMSKVCDCSEESCLCNEETSQFDAVT